MTLESKDAACPLDSKRGAEVAYQARSAAHPFGSLTATALDAIAFNPVRYVIPGVLPEGLALLAGKPKFGKSFAALDMLIAVASGGMAFGTIKCEAGDVLYCALEDSERRLQDRIRKMLPLGTEMPARLHLETISIRVGQGLVEALENWINAHPDARLIVLDTWRCVKPLPNGRQMSGYDEDATGLHPLHELAKAHPGLAILIVHHTRKLEAEDPFDTISGTNGLTGVADTLIVLAKHGEGAKLAGRSRDMDDYEKALTRDKVTGGWLLVGDARNLAKTGERQRLLDVLHEADGEVLRTSTIAKAAGVSESSASHRLKSLVVEGLVTGAGYGKWKVLDPHQSGQSRQSGKDADGDDAPHFDRFDDFDGADG